MSHDHSSWLETLTAMYDFAWQRITRGVHDRRAAARHPTLATVSEEGWPQARTVVLRKAYRSSSRLEIHTNLHSKKVSELKATPIAALHIWDAACRLQIRLIADATISSGSDVLETWNSLPAHSRGTYSSQAIPGAVITRDLGYSSYPDPSAFAVIQLDIHAIDLLYLGRSHRRAQFKQDDQWRGVWVCP
jgi:pyridoxine/pyridoxamine 5'-phosphate oxidase